MKLKFRPLVAALSVGILALGMASCGSSDDSGDSGNTGSVDTSQAAPTESGTESEAPASNESEAPSTPEKLTKVSVALTAFHSLHMWAVVGEDYKLFEPWGIDLDVVIVDGTPKVVPALISGDVQITSLVPNQLIAAYKTEPSIQFINQAMIGSPYVLVANDGVDSLEDLKGKTIGVNGIGTSADYFDIKSLLATKGMEEGSDYTLVQTGGTPQRVSSLSAKQVDATLLWEPDVSRAVAQGAHVLFKLSDDEDLATEMVNGFGALKSWYDDNRETAERWLRGYEDTIRFMQDPANKDKVKKSIETAFKVDDQLAEKTYQQFLVDMPQQNPVGTFDEAPFRHSIELAQSMNFEPVMDVDLDDLGKYYDATLVEDAAALTK